VTVLDDALQLWDAGLAVIPVKADGTKAPAVEWKPYITTPPTRAQVEAWFGEQGHAGVGVITGATSGGLEMVELEGRAAARLPQVNELADDSGLGDLWRRITGGWVELSPSGGWHFHYRITGGPVAGNTKLAKAADKLVLAETRGEGGFVVVAPTPGSHHPTGKPWVRLIGDPTSCPTITADERDAVHLLFRDLDETPPPAEPIASNRSVSTRSEADGTSPGDDYEQRTDWTEILGPVGWTLVFTRGRTRYWRRPGKTIGISATTGHADDRDRLYVFTTSTDFEAERPYTKFGAYAALEHAGDHVAAARALRGDGYGAEPTTPTVQAQLDHLVPPPVLTILQGGQPATDGANALATQPAAVSTLARSEDGHAQQLIATYGEMLRYCPERERWLTWTGHLWAWQSKSGGDVREYAKKVARILPAGDTGSTGHKRRSLSAAGVSACLMQASTDPRVVVHIDRLDADPWTLNTPAGLVDLRTGNISTPQPDSLVTKTTTVAPIADAGSDVWDAFLADTFGGDQEMAGYVQRLFGISLIGHVLEQVLPFAHGLGANGKSTLLEAVMHAVGVGESGYSIAAPAEMLMIRKHSEHPAELAQLAGARLVVCSELDDGQRFAEAKMKQLTGRDRINARFLYGQPFTFAPSHTIWLLGNHRPQAMTGGMAFWRRVKLIEFAHTVPTERRDPALGDKLAAAAGHILAWVIAGAVDYHAHGIREPDSVAKATAAYAEDQDTVARFLEDLVQLTPTNQAARVPGKTLRAAYEAWCGSEGESPVSPKRLTQELADRWNIGLYRNGTSRGYAGLVLLTSDSGEPDEKAWWKE
jgi:putative DNA primase/helicase